MVECLSADASNGRASADTELRLYSPHALAAIVAELDGQGVPPADALEGTGLKTSQLECHTTKISYRQLETAVRNALRLTRDRTIALAAGQRMHVTAYGMYGYALLSSPTRDNSRKFAGRFIKMHGPFCDIVFAREGPEVRCVLSPLHWRNPADDIHRFAIEFALAAHLTTFRDILNAPFKFSFVAVDYPAPEHAGVYDSLFECPVHFGRGGTEYRYDRFWSEAPIALADSRSHAMARELCQQVLETINRAGGLASSVRRMLMEQPGRRMGIESVAKAFGMHPRALRRKLEAEGTTFRELLAEVRMRLAIEYLRKTQMTNEDIATRLGYSDAANFRHAFFRWTGKNPSEVRADARV